MINQDASDWDPLPATETGWHPGEAQKVVPTARTEPAATAPATVVAPAGPPAMLPAPVPDSPRTARRPGLRTASPMLPPVRIEPGLRGNSAGMQTDAAPAPRAKAPAGDLASLMKVEAAPTPKKPGVVVGVPVASSTTVARARTNDASPAPLPPGIDARERESWFQAMPVVEQVRLRRAWLEPDALTTGVASGNRSQQLLERFWVAYVVFFLAALPLMLTEGLAGFVRMAMAGCVTGMVWQVVPHTRRSCAASAVGVYAVVALAPRFRELIAQPFDLLVALGGAVIVGYLSALGAGHERKPVEVVEAD